MVFVRLQCSSDGRSEERREQNCKGWTLGNCWGPMGCGVLSLVIPGRWQFCVYRGDDELKKRSALP